MLKNLTLPELERWCESIGRWWPWCVLCVQPCAAGGPHNHPDCMFPTITASSREPASYVVCVGTPLALLTIAQRGRSWRLPGAPVLLARLPAG